MSGAVDAEPEPAVQRGRHRPGSGAAARVGRQVACVVAALLSIGTFVAYGYAWFNYTSLDRNLQRRAIDVAPLSTPAASGGGGSGGTRRAAGVAQNILIVGDDSRDGLSVKQQKALHVGSDDGTNSTDTVILAHVPADGAKATLISIPRDSWVEIPGYGMGKINSAYEDGYRNAPGTNASAKDRQRAGANELIATVDKLTGVRANHYIQVGFGGFYTIANAIGGIDVTLCQAVDDTVARNRAEGQIAGSGFKMSAGHHHLDAVQSLEFVRQRHNLPGPNGNDIGREQRQRYFLAQAFDKIASKGVLLNPIKLHNLIDTVTTAFFLDGGFSLQNFADQMLTLNSQHIVGQTIPVANIDGHIGNQSVVFVDPTAVRTKVAALIARGSAPPAAATKDASPTSTMSPRAPRTKKATTPSGCIY